MGVAFYFFSVTKPQIAAIFLLISGLCDVLDGRIARRTSKTTPFGAYLDSLLDRYSDALLFSGLIFYFIKTHQNIFAIFSFIAFIGAFMISYARARIEGLGGECRVGLMQRPVRIGVVIFGAFTSLLKWVVIALAFLNHFTLIERTLHAYRLLKKDEGRLFN